MKPLRAEFSARYRSALHASLRKKGPANGDRPQGLGRAALTSGLVTRDLARIHEQALVSLVSAHDFTDPRSGSLRRAGFFLTQALIPLEAAQRATRRSHRRLQQRNEVLRLHAVALAAGNRHLQREVARREAGEVAIRRGKARYQKLLRESQVMHRKLRQLTRQIISAQEEERKEISRELHDQVVQTLVGINVQLSALSRGTSLGVQTMKSKLALTRRLVEKSVSEVHRFARELRPAALDDLGLIPALHAYCRNLAARKKIKIQLTAFSGVELLASAKRTVFFRVAQEALNNVVRHSQATEAGVIIRETSGALQLEVTDNGKSFEVEKTLLAKSNKRLGLIGMRERVEMVGGSLTVESVPGRGTAVRARIPFPTPKAKS
jgi:signal transduction histidine kinase